MKIMYSKFMKRQDYDFKSVLITGILMIKKNLLCLLFTFMLISAFSVIFFKIVSEAEEESGIPRYKYFTQIEVKYGETLNHIAEKYYTEEYGNHDNYIQEIRNLNHLYDEYLSPGMYLILPYYDAYK